MCCSVCCSSSNLFCCRYCSGPQLLEASKQLLCCRLCCGVCCSVCFSMCCSVFFNVLCSEPRHSWGLQRICCVIECVAVFCRVLQRVLQCVLQCASALSGALRQLVNTYMYIPVNTYRYIQKSYSHSTLCTSIVSLHSKVTIQNVFPKVYTRSIFKSLQSFHKSQSFYIQNSTVIRNSKFKNQKSKFKNPQSSCIQGGEDS